LHRVVDGLTRNERGADCDAASSGLWSDQGAANEVNVRLRCETFGEYLQPIRPRFTVIVDHRDDLARRGPHAGVARHAETSLAQVNVSHTAVGFRSVLTERAHLGVSLPDHEQLPILPRLPMNGLYCVSQAG
jgi:hypothetical protein